MESAAGLMSGLGACENFSLSRLKAPAKGVLEAGTAGLPHAQPWLRRHPCTPAGPAGLAHHAGAAHPPPYPRLWPRDQQAPAAMGLGSAPPSPAAL